MARTQSADYDERRQHIIDTSTELFAAHGFHKTSISEIAASCKISKSLLYHYFSSKREMLFCSVEGHTRALSQTARAIVRGSGDPEDKFRHLTRDFLQLYEKAKAKHIVLLNELEALGAEDRDLIIAQEDGVVSLISTLIGDILGGGHASRANLTVFSMLFLGMINWTYTWFDPAKGLTSEQIADLAADLFIGGLKNGHFLAFESKEPESALK